MIFEQSSNAIFIFNPIVVVIFKQINHFSSSPLHNPSVVEVGVPITFHHPINLCMLIPNKFLLV